MCKDAMRLYSGSYKNTPDWGVYRNRKRAGKSRDANLLGTYTDKKRLFISVQKWTNASSEHTEWTTYIPPSQNHELAWLALKMFLKLGHYRIFGIRCLFGRIRNSFNRILWKIRRWRNVRKNNCRKKYSQKLIFLHFLFQAVITVGTSGFWNTWHYLIKRWNVRWQRAMHPWKIVLQIIRYNSAE